MLDECQACEASATVPGPAPCATRRSRAQGLIWLLNIPALCCLGVMQNAYGNFDEWYKALKNCADLDMAMAQAIPQIGKSLVAPTMKSRRRRKTDAAFCCVASTRIGYLIRYGRLGRGQVFDQFPLSSSRAFDGCNLDLGKRGYPIRKRGYWFFVTNVCCRTSKRARPFRLGSAHSLYTFCQRPDLPENFSSARRIGSRAIRRSTRPSA